MTQTQTKMMRDRHSVVHDDEEEVLLIIVRVMIQTISMISKTRKKKEMKMLLKWRTLVLT